MTGIFQKNWDKEFIFDSLTEKKVSYSSFFNSFVSSSKLLKDSGIKKGDLVCLLMSNSLELLILYFGCLISGIKVVPIDPNKGENDIKEVIELSSPKAVIANVSAPFLSNAVSSSKFIEFRANSSVGSDSVGEYFQELDFDSPFLISFTSGSTGVPKGVINSFNNLVESGLAFGKEFNFSNKHVFYHNLPMTYMAGILNLFIMPLVCESRIVLGERFNVSKLASFWETPSKCGVNVFWFIPTVVSLLNKLDRGTTGVDYAKKTTIIGCVGTAPLSNSTKVFFEKKYGITLYESYGLSETLFVSTNSPSFTQIENSVGKCLDGVSLSFSKDEEILVGVPWMFKGYSNVEFKSCFEKSKFKSGDLGLIDENGFLKITGRKKDLIIRGGINISPRKIEEFILSLDLFDEVVVLGFKDEVLGEKIVCFVCSSTFNDEKKRLLNARILSSLGRDYKIDEFVKLDSIPKNINGKIDKLKLRELYGGKNP